MIIAVEFRGSIGPVIPYIIALLTDSDENDRGAAADMLSKLSEHGKFLSL